MTVIGPIGFSERRNVNLSQALDEDREFEKNRIIKGTAELKEELFSGWKKRYRGVSVFPGAVAALSQEAIDQLLSFNLVAFYDDLARKFSLSHEQRNMLPQVVWETAIKGDFNRMEERLRQSINAENPVIQSLAAALSEKVESRIGKMAGRSAGRPAQPAEAPRSGKVQAALAEALKKHEKLGEQLITVNPITLKIFPSPVRPSIKNWIADYQEKAEARRHDSIERGNYLFHSENAKKLTSGERQKLGAVLKSLDDGSPLTIDAVSGTVVFDTENFMTPEPVRPPAQAPAAPPARPVQAPAPPPVAPRPIPRPVPPPAPRASFSSPQRMPFEGRGKSAAEVFATHPAAQKAPTAPKISGNTVDLRS